MASNIYEFSVKDIEGREIKLSDYKGKPLLIVNTASKCGYTPQYEGLQSLYENYREKGLEILAFPCNQFGGQEPGTNEEIKDFCESTYNITFKLFDKVDVKGENQHPLFRHLTNEASGFLTKDIKWNFTKFLIDKNGNVIDRFAPMTPPSGIEDKLMEILNK